MGPGLSTHNAFGSSVICTDLNPYGEARAQHGLPNVNGPGAPDPLTNPSKDGSALEIKKAHEPRAWSTISELFASVDFPYHPGCSCGWSTREEFPTTEEANAWTREVHIGPQEAPP